METTWQPLRQGHILKAELLIIAFYNSVARYRIDIECTQEVALILVKNPDFVENIQCDGISLHVVN